MNKFKILLAAVICMLLSVNAMAQTPCVPLSTTAIVKYSCLINPLPAELCVTLTWNFSNGAVYNQNERWLLSQNSPIPAIGYLTFPFTLPYPYDCMTENDVVSMTLKVWNFNNSSQYATETLKGYNTSIAVHY